MEYDELRDKAYELYKEDWCDQRGCAIDEYDDEEGFYGENYASLEEFEDNEFTKEEIMTGLLSSEDLVTWTILMD